MPTPNQFQLLTKRRFLPLFLTQFLAAFNDNAFKNSLAVLITYRIATQVNMDSGLLVTLTAGLFILPYLLFSAIAGQLADKYEKSSLIRLIKIFEIILMLIAMVAFLTSNLFLLMLVIFMLGVHSTFFGPLKYAILPQHLCDKELLSGNGLVEAGTFIAILLGNIFGGIFVLNNMGLYIISIFILFIAVLGFISSIFIPRAESSAADLKINYNIFLETLNIVSYVAKTKNVFLCIIGISWFWFIGIIFLTHLPNFTKNIIGANQDVYTFFLATFSIGIAIGSVLCNRLLQGRVDATYIPFAAIGMTIFIIDLFFTSRTIIPQSHVQLLTIGQFLFSEHGWHVFLDLLLTAVCGGLYTVPLYALLQVYSKESHRSRVIASNNIMNALFMVGATLFSTAMLAAHFSVVYIFLAIAIANIFSTFYICKLLSYEFIKSLVRSVLKIFYRVKVNGLENFEKAGDHVLVVANHVSFLDPPLIGAFLPEKLTFAVNTLIARKWWMKPLLASIELYPMDPANPMAAKTMVDLIRQGKKCVIFPEGRITMTGALMKVYEGPSMIAAKAGAKILPLRIDGAQFTPFSRLKGKIKLRWFPKITLTLLEPRNFSAPSGLVGRSKRQRESLELYDTMAAMVFKSSKQEVTLFQSLLDACKTYGKHHEIIEDKKREPITYRQFITQCFILGKTIAKKTDAYVGILLPNAIEAVVMFFGLHAFNRVPVVLNYSISYDSILSACKTANLKVICTSREFIQASNFLDLVTLLESNNIKVNYLEDFYNNISVSDKIKGKLIAKFPNFYYYYCNRFHEKNIKAAAQNPAAIIFTSGSEDTPKGVVLSHLNIQANCYQISSRIDFGSTDVIFNALPLFHSFGLTAGTLLPLLFGVKTFLYPSPLHYRVIPELIYDTNATILFSTNTFLSAYAKCAHPYDFYSIRYVFAGAEKLQEATRKLWVEQFGIKVFEGYGATETSPVLAINTPMHHKPGTVGRLVPGIYYRLEPVPGLQNAGKLMVSGPNVMLGYLSNKMPGELIPLVNNEYDTGDIVTIDDEKYITIHGRVKRFAKIAGEMVSLSAVESYLALLWPDCLHAIIAVIDERKGEQLILVTDYKDADHHAIVRYVDECKLSELTIPKKIIIVPQVPLLATGKIDYVKVKELIFPL